MKKFLVLIAFLISACSADWLSDQNNIYYPGVTGMANIGDYMRVKSLDSNGEVFTMEALPQSDILLTFSMPQTYSTSNYAKLMDVTIPSYSEKWSGSYIVSTVVDWALAGNYDPGVAILQLSGDYYNLYGMLVSSGTFPREMMYIEDKGNGNYSVMVKSFPDANGFGIFGSLVGTSDPNMVQYYSSPSFGYTPTGTVNAVTNPFSRDYLRSVLSSVDANKVIEVDGRLATYNEDSWNSPTLQNSWTNYGSGWAAAAYRKMPDGRIEIKGLVKSGTLNAVIFTLPTGYRPSEHRMFSVIQGDQKAVRLNISSSGSVYTSGATANQYQSIEASFYP